MTALEERRVSPRRVPRYRLEPSRGISGYLASTDHKRIAVLTFLTTFVFFLGGGVMALLMRTELADPGYQFLSRHAYNELFTMHGSVMIYLVVTPIALALGLYLVPLQVGASGIFAPRLALAGYWLLLGGGLMMLLGFATQSGAGRAGWFSYYPLSNEQYTPGTGMDLWILGVVVSQLGTTLLGWTILLTIFRRRAPGMTFLRLPPMTWTQIVTCFMVITAFPVLLIAMGILEYDRRTGGSIYDSVNGPGIYQHLFWFFGHPVVYVMFFPFVACVIESVTALSRKRFFGYVPFVVSMLVFSALSMSVWAHHMYASGFAVNEYFALTSTLLAIPAGVEYFGIIATMWGGAILWRTPILFSVGFLLQFLIGGLSGIWVASPPLDYHATDSYVVVAHMHYVLFGGSLFGLFAGVYYWWPKATGTMLREGLGRLHFALLALGTNITFFPMFFLGWIGMVRRVPDYKREDLSLWWLNPLETAGAFLIAVSIVVFIVNAVVSLRRPVHVEDPWEGHSLEWWTSSPPPRHNFDSLPPITSYAPVFDARHGARARAG